MAAGRTPAGLGMDWVKQLADKVGAERVLLNDGWHHPKLGTGFAVGQHGGPLGAPDPETTPLGLGQIGVFKTRAGGGPSRFQLMHTSCGNLYV